VFKEHSAYGYVYALPPHLVPEFDVLLGVALLLGLGLILPVLKHFVELEHFFFKLRDT